MLGAGVHSLICLVLGLSMPILFDVYISENQIYPFESTSEVCGAPTVGRSYSCISPVSGFSSPMALLPMSHQKMSPIDPLIAYATTPSLLFPGRGIGQFFATA